MSDVLTVNCRGINLLKIPESSPTRPEQEGSFYVSLHQLSVQLQKLFKTTPGSVYKTIGDLGIALCNCSKKNVLFLREHSVINSYKASKLTLKGAEELFNAVQEREKRTHGRTKKKKVGSKINTRQISPPGRGKEDKILLAVACSSDDFQKGQLFDRCVLYGGSPRPLRIAKSTNNDHCELEGEDELLENSDCISELNSLIVQSPQGMECCKAGNIQQEEIEAQKQPTSLHTTQCTTPSSCSYSSHHLLPCMEKMNGYQRPLHRVAVDTKLEQKVLMPRLQGKSQAPSTTNNVHGNEERVAPYCTLPISPLSDLSEESVISRPEHCTLDKLSRFVYVTDSTDEDEDRVGVADISKRQKRQGGWDIVMGNSIPAQPALPKRVVVTKLRHFAKVTSPKIRTTSFITHNASIGKHLPLSPSSTSSMENSSSTIFPEPLLVRIPRSKLNTSFHPDIVPRTDFCSSYPLTSFGRAPSNLSRAPKERIRQQRYKIGGRKPTALSAFVSKKRAATRTPSPLTEILPVECLNTISYPKGFPQDDRLLQVPYSDIPKPGKRFSGKVIHAYTSHVSKPHPSMRSDWSPLDNGCKEHKGIKEGRIKKSRKGKTNRETSVEQTVVTGNDLVISEDDLVSVASSSASSTTYNSSSKSALPEKTDQYSGRPQSSAIDQLGSSNFCLSKLFDTLQPKLVVRNEELCPELSLSLRGLERSKFNVIPASHPVWTWRLGQSTNKGTSPIRSYRPRSTKTKSHL